MDKLERQILNNRLGLDHRVPDPEIWNRIQIEQKRSRIRVIKRLSGWAAIFLLLVSSTFLFFPTRINPDKLPAELLETEVYYSARVNALFEKAKPILTEYPSLNRDLMSEINNLDSLYMEIKKDLKDNISNDEVIEALILNYRAKVQILEEMLDILNEDELSNENLVSYEI